MSVWLFMPCGVPTTHSIFYCPLTDRLLRIAWYSWWLSCSFVQLARKGTSPEALKMAFLFKVFSWSERLKDTQKSAEIVNKTFQQELVRRSFPFVALNIYFWRLGHPLRWATSKSCVRSGLWSLLFCLSFWNLLLATIASFENCDYTERPDGPRHEPSIQVNATIFNFCSTITQNLYQLVNKKLLPQVVDRRI